MSGGFRVRPVELEIRSIAVGTVAGQVAGTATAGRPLDLLAYGVVGQAFALTAVHATDAGVAAVRGLRHRLRDHSELLRATAADYRRAERSTAARLGDPP